MSNMSQPGNIGPGQIISSVRSIRLAIFLVTTSLISACAVFNVIEFVPSIADPLVIDNVTSNNVIPGNFTTVTMTIEKPPDLNIPPIYLFLCGLSLAAISSFLRANFILKLFMMILSVLLQTAILYTSQVFQKYEDYVDNDIVLVSSITKPNYATQ